ncbi:hypothetical protein BV898_05216 [Hypsibius exemplaris]|uniref:G-protein coupled receptors family 1 profile domain-containing protein n=1 Tax=Hypsibius exemplaris TaxID=2072580 RepID=A0A1W0X073_HYPEX|nr:hypothetical protein BV898_05216 [Hypsibius exemplaris]
MNTTGASSNTTELWQQRNATGANQTCSPMTPADLIATQLPTVIFGTIMTSTQLFNLFIFALWHNKEPYILLHVSLAFASLLAGISVITAVPLRYIPLTAGNLLLNKLLGVVLISYGNFSSVLANVAISLDRWMSVEFAIKYRTAISSHKTLFVSVVFVFGGSLVMHGLGIPVFWRFITVDPCTRRKNFEGIGLGYVAWNTVHELVFLPVLFVSQARILWIALGFKLQRLRRERNIKVSMERPKPGAEMVLAPILRIAWSSLLASMTIVGVTLISNVPSLSLTYIYTSAGPYLRRIGGYMTFVQHCTSPLIYLIFWPEYRAVLFRLCRRLQVLLTPQASLA